VYNRPPAAFHPPNFNLPTTDQACIPPDFGRPTAATNRNDRGMFTQQQRYLPVLTFADPLVKQLLESETSSVVNCAEQVHFDRWPS
jgi:hypothetical protein